MVHVHTASYTSVSCMLSNIQLLFQCTDVNLDMKMYLWTTQRKEYVFIYVFSVYKNISWHTDIGFFLLPDVGIGPQNLVSI